MTLKSLLKNYDSVDPNINEKNFPRPKKIETKEWKLIKFKKRITSQDALKEIKKQGCHAANLWELAQWRMNNDVEIEVYSIVALGQMYKNIVGDHMIPFINPRWGGVFSLNYLKYEWNSDDAFLCFCDNTLENFEYRIKVLEEFKEKINKVINNIKTL